MNQVKEQIYILANDRILYNKNISSQCKLTAQLEQVQDKLN
jgi:hypothetical protein